MTEKLTVTTTVEVSWDRITDMFIGAIEGGSTYWCYDFFMDEPAEFPKPKTSKESDRWPWYGFPEFWSQDHYKIRVRHDACEAGKDDGEGTWTTYIGPEDVRQGLAIFAAKYPHHFADMMQENDDASTADVFFQCVILKEVVFG